MIVFIGDLHGNPDALSQLALGLKLTDSRLSWSAPGISLVITGDVCDRGRDSAVIYRTLMSWQESAPAFGSEVIFLIGNHEVLNISGITYYNTPVETASYALSAGENGDEAKRAAFAPGGWLYNWLSRQRFIIKIGPFIAAHADFPSAFRSKKIDEIEDESRRLFFLASEGIEAADELLWSRDAYYRSPGYGINLGMFLKANSAEYWVCGHTPAPDGKIRRGYSGRYICIDTAMGLRPGCASALVYKDGEIFAAYPDNRGGMLFTQPIDF